LLLWHIFDTEDEGSKVDSETSVKLYLAVNVPYVHLLPEYWDQLDVSLPPEDDPKFLACCVLSENLPQFDFGEFPHHLLETITPKILNEWI
jgi:hypothetical protein